MNLRLSTISCIIALLLLSSPAVRADGLVVDGHVSGKHTDLLLTFNQMKDLFRGSHWLVLTPSQKKYLTKVTPKAAKIDRLEVFPSSYFGCTCELANAAMQTTPWSVEVADELLGRDLNAEFRAMERSYGAKKETR